MTLFLIGMALFGAIHLIPSLAPGVKEAIQHKLGAKAYQGLFAISAIAAITLIVMGWRATTPFDLYEPPVWGRPIASLLILAAFTLFLFSRFKTNLKRVLRHPQLTGVVVWSIGHLLVNGDNYSFVLFVGFALWAIGQMALINRREGAWQKPDAVALTAEILPSVVSLAAFVAFLFAHEYLIGVSPFP